MAKVQTNGNGSIYLNQSGQVLLGNDIGDDTTTIVPTSLLTISPVEVSSSINYPNLTENSGYFTEAFCYDTKRNVWYLAQRNDDPSQTGIIHTFTNILDPSTLTDSTTAEGKHFNDMEYDPINDKIWVACADVTGKGIVVLNPETKAIEKTILLPGNILHACCIDKNNSCAYVLARDENNAGPAYITKLDLNGNEDVTFEHIVAYRPKAIDRETMLWQGMCFYNGYVILESIINYSFNSYPSTAPGQVEYRRTLCCFYDINSGNKYVVGFNVSQDARGENIVYLNGVLYSLHVSRTKLSIYKSVMDQVNSGGLGNRATIINETSDLNNYISEGKYCIRAWTLNNAPPLHNLYFSSMEVTINSHTGDVIQRIIGTYDSSYVRMLHVVDKQWTPWKKEGLYCQRTSTFSLDNETSGVFSGPISDAPSGSDGLLINTISYNSTNNDDMYLRQFYTSNETNEDNLFYMRFAKKLSGTTTYNQWYKFYTNKDIYINDYTNYALVRPYGSQTNKALRLSPTGTGQVQLFGPTSVFGFLIPNDSGTYNLGNSSHLWKEVFAANATINTSDERLKQDIEDIDEKVFRAWAKVDFKQFRFKDAVEQKGKNARIHFGVIAQRVKEAFESEGLDAFKYGLLCYDEWEAEPEEKDEEGNIINPGREAGNAYGIRYAEALALECAYQRHELEQLKAQLNK